MSPAAAARTFVRSVLTPEGDVRDDVASLLLEEMSRSQLKSFAAALRRELGRRTVTVTIAGDAGAARSAVSRQYPGRPVAVADDPALGAGLQVQAGDDIVDASVRGIIRKIIAELGST
jgi:hypothetical protein